MQLVIYREERKDEEREGGRERGREGVREGGRIEDKKGDWGENNDNTLIVAISLPTSTTHPQLWEELLTFKPKCTI